MLEKRAYGYLACVQIEDKKVALGEILVVSITTCSNLRVLPVNNQPDYSCTTTDNEERDYVSTGNALGGH